MVGSGGLEPPTPSVSRKYSNQLSYEPTKVGIIIVMAAGAGGQIPRRIALAPACDHPTFPCDLSHIAPQVWLLFLRR